MAKKKEIKKVDPLKDLPKVEDGDVFEKRKHKGLGFFMKRKLKKKPETSWFIEMFFSNGTSREFIIQTKQETFDFLGRTYYLRHEDSWFNLTQNQYKLNFHDDCVTPLKRTIIKQGNENFFKVTPENVKPLIKMNYIKALASSEELDRYLKMVATMVFIMAGLLLFLLYKFLKFSKAMGG